MELNWDMLHGNLLSFFIFNKLLKIKGTNPSLAYSPNFNKETQNTMLRWPLKWQLYGLFNQQLTKILLKEERKKYELQTLVWGQWNGKKRSSDFLLLQHQSLTARKLPKQHHIESMRCSRCREIVLSIFLILHDL